MIYILMLDIIIQKPNNSFPPKKHNDIPPKIINYLRNPKFSVSEAKHYMYLLSKLIYYYYCVKCL